MVTFNKGKLLMAGVIFIALMAVAFGLHLTTFSIFLPFGGQEFERGDSISLKDALAGKVTIPTQVGDCNDEDYSAGPCYRFDPDSFLQDDIVIDITGVEEVPATGEQVVMVNVRCGSHPQLPGRGYGLGTGCVFNLDENGNRVSPLHCPDWIPVWGQSVGGAPCIILKGSKSGMGPDGSPYTEEFVINSEMWFTGAGRDGFNFWLGSVPGSAPGKTQLNGEFRVIIFGADPTTDMWLLDACVASPGLICGGSSGEVPPIDIPDVIDDLLEPIVPELPEPQQADWMLMGVMAVASGLVSGLVRL